MKYNRPARGARTKNYFLHRTNEVHPGELQFYRLPVTVRQSGTRNTTQTGSSQVSVSPDGKTIAFSILTQ